jgi:hypothetical protein
MNIATDLLYCSFDNLIEGLLPYYVSVDHERKEVGGPSPLSVCMCMFVCIVSVCV